MNIADTFLEDTASAGNVAGPGLAADRPTISPVKSTASVVAIVAAIASFALTFQHHGAGGLALGLVAMGVGAVGSAEALSPRIKGGLLSLLAIALGAIAIVFAVVMGIVHRL